MRLRGEPFRFLRGRKRTFCSFTLKTLCGQVCQRRKIDRRKSGGERAVVRATGSLRTESDPYEDEVTGARRVSGEARCMRAGIHADAEETELSAAQGGAGTADERGRSDDLHTGNRAQPAGALDRAGAGRAREGFAGSEVSHHPGDAGRRRGGKPQAGAVEVRCEAAKGRGEVGGRKDAT